MRPGPVYELTPEEAVLELEQLCDQKPPEDQPRELHHWRQANQGRVDELETWILMRTPKPAPEPIPEPAPTPIPDPPEESPMDQPSPTPDAQLAALVTRYTEAIADVGATKHQKAFEKARALVYQLRHQIKKLCERHDLAVPLITDVPADPWRKEKATAKVKAREGHAAGFTEGGFVPPSREPLVPMHPERPAPASLAEAASSVLHLKAVQSIANIRSSIWTLMAELEKMPAELRASLIDELGLLDAAAHASHCLATGKLEVA